MPQEPSSFKGWFGPTDHRWFEFLRARRELDEVNFWVPSGTLPFTRSVPIGSPFFFKLKAPHNAIGGFGYLAHTSILPLRLAWEAFGEKNGAADYESVAQSIIGYRNDIPPGASHYQIDIGCLMISEPTFFPDGQFIPQPRDWPAQAVRGKSLSLTEGEGLRIWTECRLRASDRPSPQQVAEPTLSGTQRRYGDPLLVSPRLGQGTFRVALLDAYGRQCAVTTEHSLPVLDAAHIRPYSSGGRHELDNGLVLRTDIHRLYDLGYVGVDPNGRFRVSRRLQTEWKNGRAYYAFEGQVVHLPEGKRSRPDPKALEWHMDEVFLD